MKKKILVLFTLFFVMTYSFSLEKLNVGSYRNSDSMDNFHFDCWDDFSLRITDNDKVQIILHFFDANAMLNAASKLEDIIYDNKIYNVKQMLKFFEKEKIKYEYEQFNDSKDYFIDAQAFVEEYLVPKYGIKSGRKIVNSDCTTEYKDWNKEIGGYDCRINVYEDYRVEWKNYNKEKNYYDYCLEIYEDYRVEWKNYNKEKKAWEHKLITYSDHTEEYKNWNKEKDVYDYCLDIYEYYRVEYKNYNKDANRYEYILETYPNNPEWDCVTEYRNWNNTSEIFEYEEWLCTNVPEKRYLAEYKQWNNESQTYGECSVTITNCIITTRRIDDSFWDIDYKDKNGKLIAYEHLITPVKDGKIDIEIMNNGIIYQYFGMEVAPVDDCKWKTQSFVKIENGVQKKFESVILSSEELGAPDLDLLLKEFPQYIVSQIWRKLFY